MCIELCCMCFEYSNKLLSLLKGFLLDNQFSAVDLFYYMYGLGHLVLLWRVCIARWKSSAKDCVSFDRITKCTRRVCRDLAVAGELLGCFCPFYLYP